MGLAAVDTGLPAAVARAVPAHLRGRAFAVVYGGVSLAAVLSYLDLFRLFGVVSLLTIPLVLMMKRAAASKDAMTAH